MADRPATLVLSGGGAKGAFQVGAEKVMREVHGFRWERIFGVSVGALNAALLAQQRYDELLGIWNGIRESDIYKKVPWPIVALRVGLMKKLGFYDNSPLRNLIRKHVEGRTFPVPAIVGRVSLVSGGYELVPNDARDFVDAVWHSATMPVIWEPVSPAPYFVDGGLRTVTPLGDALALDPTEIVVIACSPGTVEPAKPPGNVIDVAKRSLTDITINEILLNDVETFVRINDLVRQASEANLTLTKPDGTPYRYCRITVVIPTMSLGDTLDFSPAVIQARMRHGEERARATVLPTGIGPGERMPPQMTTEQPLHA